MILAFLQCHGAVRPNCVMPILIMCISMLMLGLVPSANNYLRWCLGVICIVDSSPFRAALCIVLPSFPPILGLDVFCVTSSPIRGINGTVHQLRSFLFCRVSKIGHVEWSLSIIPSQLPSLGTHFSTSNCEHWAKASQRLNVRGARDGDVDSNCFNCGGLITYNWHQIVFQRIGKFV